MLLVKVFANKATFPQKFSKSSIMPVYCIFNEGSTNIAALLCFIASKLEKVLNSIYMLKQGVVAELHDDA